MFSDINENFQGRRQAVRRYYLLTSRNNLMDLFSSGQIKPASHYLKYYPDLGEKTPAGVPLLLQPPSDELIRETVRQEERAIPAILELPPAGDIPA